MSDRSTRVSKLRSDKRSRISYIRAKLNVLVPAQIRALRVRLFEKQQSLAEDADMKQSRISAMERPGAVQFNLDTLVRLAASFKVGLVVKFVPFSEMLKWENGFSQDHFAVATIDEDTTFLLRPEEEAHQTERKAVGRETFSLYTTTVSDGKLTLSNPQPSAGYAPPTEFIGNSKAIVVESTSTANRIRI